MNDLIVLEKLDPIVIYTEGGLDVLLHECKSKVAEHTPDTSTVSGRKAIASLARTVSSTKVIVDDLGKNLTAKWRKQTGEVNASRKNWRDEMDDLRDSTRQPLTDWESVEKDRIAVKALAREIEQSHTEALEMEALFEREREVARKEAEIMAAQAAHNERERVAYEKHLESERMKKIKQDAEDKAKRDADAAAQKAIDDAKLKADLAERDRLAAFERERVAKETAERKAKEARERAEREKIEAVEKVKREEREAAELKERNRLADEAEAKAMAEKLARHKAHRAKVEREITQDLTTVGLAMPDDEFKDFINHVNNGNIRHITINY